MLLLNLYVRDGHGVFEDDPLHGLGAGRRGERAVVDEVLVGGVGQEAQQREGAELTAFTCPHISSR